MRTTLRLAALLGSTALAGAAAPALAATPAWTGNTSSDWFDATNWTTGVPMAGDITTIQSANPVLVSGATATTFDLHVANMNGSTVNLTISGGGVLNVTNSQDVSVNTGSSTTIVVTGAGSMWTPRALTLGNLGAVNLSVLNGGKIDGLGANVATGATSVVTIVVDGAGSLWNATNNISVGSSGGTASLTISNGGQVIADQTLIGGLNGMVNLSGAGSMMKDNSFTTVGQSGTSGTLNVTAGATLQSGVASIGGNAAGQATFDGMGTTWTVNNNLLVGSGNSNATLTLSNGSATTVGGAVGVKGGAGVTGVVNIGAPSGMGAAAPGTLNVGFFGLADPNASLVLNHTSANYTFAAAFTGNGVISQQAGVTHLTGNSQTFMGTTNITGGTLFVDNSLGGTVNVGPGGTLAGTGFLTGPLTLPNGAALNGTQGQTLNFGAALVLSPGTVLNVTLGAPGGSTPLFNVGGALTLDGVLNVTNAMGFGPGTYRLINYGGMLTDNGLSLGTLPAGTTAGQFTVQTSVAQQVNLIYTGMAPPPPVGPFVFWEGASAARGDGRIEGGSGVWTGASTFFANADGTGAAPLTAPDLFPIFTAEPGTVRVDTRSGPVRISGLQLAVDGYRIEGDAIDLVGDLNTIRVGDGTTDGAAYTGEIAAALQGAGGIDKNDLGVLILSGANSFTGETRISAGVLSLSGGGSLAASSGVTANAVFDIGGAAAPVTIKSLAGVGEVRLGATNLILSDATGRFDGAIHGRGGVAVLSGTQVLAGDSDYTGGTQVAARGNLILGGGGTSGSVVGPIAVDGVVAFDRRDDVTFAGRISGAGGVVQQGAGSLRLTSANTYAGGTLVTNGSLVGAADAFGSGAISANARLVLDQGADATFANRLDGTGFIDKRGAGGLSLTGGGGFSGQLGVLEGRLALNADLASAAVSVASGATLGGNGKMASLSVAPGGIVAPGNSVGRLQVAGDYTQAAGAILRAEVGPTGADQLIVGGVARLDAGAKLQIVPASGTYALGQQMMLLQASGGVQGTFTVDGAMTLTPFMGLQVRYDGGRVMLEAVKTGSFATAARSASQSGVAAAADSLAAGSGVNQALARLTSDTAARAAFEQLTGDLHVSAVSSGIEDSRLVRDALAAHLSDEASGRGAWGAFVGGWGATASDGEAASVRRRTAGAIVGIDLPLEGAWRAGVLAGWGRAHLSGRSHAAAAAGSTYTLGAYAAWNGDGVSVTGGLSQTWTSLHLRRAVAFDGLAETLASSPDLKVRQAFVRGTYALRGFGDGLRAVGEVAYVNVGSGATTESGGAAALTLASRDQGVAIATLGLQDEWTLRPGLTARLGLGWRGVAGDLSPTLRAAFAGSSAFETRGAPLARHEAVLQAGLRGEVARGVVVEFGYAAQASRRTTGQTVRLDASWRF